jgi:hypothetical protein
MAIGDAFRGFAERVLAAVKKGGLPSNEQKKLDHLLSRTGKRNLVLARGILTALDAGGATKSDVKRFGELLEAANSRIVDEKAPFNDKERLELTEMFRRAYVPKRTSGWFSSHLDELLAQEINDSLRERAGIPKKTPETIGEKKKMRV